MAGKGEASGTGEQMKHWNGIEGKEGETWKEADKRRKKKGE